MKSEVTSIFRGHSGVSAHTNATSCSRNSSTNSGVTKLACRISIACRIGRFSSTFIHDRPLIHLSWPWAMRAADSLSCGNSAKKLSIRLASKRKFGGSCHKIGPSFAPSRKIPDAKKFATGPCASFSRRIWVMKRGPFTEKTKSAGVSAAHDAKFSGRDSE